MLMMSIQQFCQKYGCDKSAVYRKIKRKHLELSGHISENGVIEIDEYAEKLLKPKEIKSDIFKKLQDLEYDNFLKNEKISILENDKSELSQDLSDLRKSYDKLSEENAEIRAERDDLKSRNEVLFSENQILKSSLEKKTQKSIFGRINRFSP